ncbi:MAG: ATP phosphoribosyltransferase [Paracoccaceae bacterium]|nr:ATP phosphoribosyltransferase [Paracoccaceae bacterium]MDE2917973.1 ATP phosphoribosyltransferase [Paracoccaceae bacterium]MYE37575.1 ATP phosphoribosyltransferase [Paracoccaceae bacterium]
MNKEVRLNLAIQKTGRLADESRSLLERCGIDLLKSKDQLVCKAQNFPLDVFFVRVNDIPTFVATNACHIGIISQNILMDEQTVTTNPQLKSIQTLMELGFGRCRLSIAVPNSSGYQGIKAFEGKRIATSYQGLLREYLKENDVNCDIVPMQGAVEIAPRMGMADAICDLVSTGTTLAINGLKEVEVIFESQSVLIRNSELTTAQEELLERLMLRLKSVQVAKKSKYIMLHCPIDKLEEIKSILPGSEAPTILALQGREDLVAVHAVCNEGVFWNTMEDLKAMGASSIMVLPIEKMLD